MIKKLWIFLVAVWTIQALSAGSEVQNFATAGSTPPLNTSEEFQTAENNMSTEQENTNILGAMSPEDALEYMKTVPELVIIDTATAREYEQQHFDGAVNIHYTEMAKRYSEIPGKSTVLLHCRLGMVVPQAYKVLLENRTDLKEISYIDGAPLFEDYNRWKAGQRQEQAQKLLGGLSPEDALEYMKNTPDLLIIEVNASEWKLSTGFIGAMWIPYTEMEERYDEIPEGHPVLIHCGGGIVSVPVYEMLVKKRPDIPELSYIAGVPPVKAYNEWMESQQQGGYIK